MRVLVTGGSGFIGTNLIEHFTTKGDHVLNIDIASPRNQRHSTYWCEVDLLDAAGLRNAVHQFQPEIILHMGARTDLDGHSLEDYSANTIGVQNLIAATQDLGSLRRIVFASSRLVCRIGYLPSGDQDYCPSTPYGESKMIGEQIVRNSVDLIPCPWIIVRPTSIWGPWFDVPYKTFFLSVSKRRYFHPGNAQILKSFGFVGNSIYELQRLLELDSETISGKTIYLADYPPIDVANMANTIQRELGVSPIRTWNIGGMRCLAVLGDGLKFLGWKNPPLTSFRLNNLLTTMVYDLEPLRLMVGDLPYSMDEGVKITVNWMKSHGELS
jgi:nucleoside-diphosphate-sugar epimerase